MVMDDIEFIEHISKLELKDGDILVLRSKDYLTNEQISNLKKYIRHIDNTINILVIDGGMEIGVLRKKEGE